MSIADIFSPLPALRPTHMLELFRIIRAATKGQIDFTDCHYTADSFVAYLTDPYDGQRYRMTLTPIKDKEVA